MADETRDQVPLLLLVAFLVRWRRLLVALSLTAALLTAGISLLLPSRYASCAVVRLPQGAGTGIILGYEPGSVCRSIVESRWMGERLVAQFDLATAYRLPDAPLETVIRALRRHTVVFEEDTSKNLIIQVEDENPRRAKEMAEYYVAQLDLRNQELYAERARDEYRFLAARLEQIEATLRQREDSLCRYQTEVGVFDVGAQALGTLQAAATLEAQRLLATTRAELARQICGAASADVDYWRRYAASLDSAGQRLLRAPAPAEHRFLLTLDAIPREQQAVLRLQRDIAAYGELAGDLLRLREKARIDAARDMSTLIRLDAPSESRRRFWPRRRLMVMLAAAVTFVFTAAAASFYETLSAAARDAAHPLYAQVQRIRRAWMTRQ